MRLTIRLLGVAAVLDGLYMLSTGFHTSGFGDAFNSLALVPGLTRLPPVLHFALSLWIPIGAALVALGRSTRVVPITLGLAYLYIALSDWGAFHQHFILAGQLFLIVAWYSVDSEDHRRAAHWALLALVTVVYVSAGLHKLNPVFWSGLVVEERTARLGLDGDWMQWAAPVMAWSTILLELLLPVALWRWPRFGTVAGVAFHSGVVVTTAVGAPFGLLMIATYFAFWDRPRLREEPLPRAADQQLAPSP